MFGSDGEDGDSGNRNLLAHDHDDEPLRKMKCLRVIKKLRTPCKQTTMAEGNQWPLIG